VVSKIRVPNFTYFINRWIQGKKFSAVGSGLMLGKNFRVTNNGVINIGKNFSAQNNCSLFSDHNAKLTIGANVCFNAHVAVLCKKSVELADEVLVGNNTVIMDSDFHGFNGEPDKAEPIKIGFHAWLGRNVLILKGVTIGEHAVVGAGSVVAKDVPSFCVAAGNPVRVIKEIKKGYTP
jgi:acetyltransferase-like isoleucine patch superfamily enzyme